MNLIVGKNKEMVILEFIIESKVIVIVVIKLIIVIISNWVFLVLSIKLSVFY